MLGAAGSAESRATASRPDEFKLSQSARPAPRFEQLRARRNAAPETVADHQRARLRSAMVEACARDGLNAATVADVVALAGVSTKTLYKHFGSKEGCFLATYDAVVADAVTRISAAYRDWSDDELEWTAALCRAFNAFVAELVERPRSSRLALVDVLVVGPDALERIERAEEVFMWMIARSLSQASDAVRLPPLMLRSIIGGIWFVSRSRLLTGRAVEVSECGEELLRWILTYRHPAAASLPRGKAPKATGPGPTISASASDPRTRMLSAAAQLASRAGYSGLSVGEIIEIAGVSREDFATEFDNPGECFLASLELFSAQVLARAMRASRDAPDWGTGVCRATHSILCQVAADPDFATAAFVEASAAGSPGSERRSRLVRAFAGVLQRRAPSDRQPSSLVAEAIVGGVWSMVHRYVVDGRAQSLPSLSGHAAYLALAPVLGAAQAHEVIVSEYAASGSS